MFPALLKDRVIRNALPVSPAYYFQDVDASNELPAGYSVRVCFQKLPQSDEWSLVITPPGGKTEFHPFGKGGAGVSFSQVAKRGCAIARKHQKDAANQVAQGYGTERPDIAWNEKPKVGNLADMKPPPWAVIARQDLEASSAMFAVEFADKLIPLLIGLRSTDDLYAAARQAFIETMEQP